MRSVIFVSLILVLTLCVPATADAAVDRGIEKTLLVSSMADPAIVEALRIEDTALVTIRFYLPAENDSMTRASIKPSRCAYWVFAGRASTASCTVDVRDSQTIQVKTYANASCPLADTSAIICNL